MFSAFFRRFSSFTYLNVTQFLGALNDNIYKLLIVYFLIQMEGIERGPEILASTGAVFVIPFLLFSAISGTLADRYSKRDIIVTTKILELVIMGLAVISFAYQSKWGSYAVLFLLATQSAIFGPSKYGIVPELVGSDKISKANGMMTSFTFLAIILGTFFASFFIQITGHNFVVSSIFCTFFALIGLVASFYIEFTPPAGSESKFRIFFVREIFKTLKSARQYVSLLPAIMGAAFFLFVGAFAQLNIIPFAVKSLGLTDVQGGYLFFLTALGIGSGALIAGKISGKIVELGLVPIGAFGIAVCCFLIYMFSENLLAVIFLVTLLGVFGGLYEIPLDSYIQVVSPKEQRGQMVAASNFLSFIGVLLASGMIYVNSEFFGLDPDQGFIIIGICCLAVMLFFTCLFFDYLTRFVASILGSIHFSTSLEGRENIPDCPVVYVCTHRAWNDTLLLLGAQRRSIRFFIEEERHHSDWMKKLYKMLRVFLLSGIEPFQENQECVDEMAKCLKKGISVCLLVRSWDIESEIEKLYESKTLRHIIEQAHYPVIPVRIYKKGKKVRSTWFRAWLRRIQVPAQVSFGSIIYQGHEASLKTPHELEICFED